MNFALIWSVLKLRSADELSDIQSWFSLDLCQRGTSRLAFSFLLYVLFFPFHVKISTCWLEEWKMNFCLILTLIRQRAEQSEASSFLPWRHELMGPKHYKISGEFPICDSLVFWFQMAQHKFLDSGLADLTALNYIKQLWHNCFRFY